MKRGERKRDSCVSVCCVVAAFRCGKTRYINRYNLQEEFKHEIKKLGLERDISNIINSLTSSATYECYSRMLLTKGYSLYSVTTRIVCELKLYSTGDIWTKDEKDPLEMFPSFLLDSSGTFILNFKKESFPCSFFLLLLLLSMPPLITNAFFFPALHTHCCWRSQQVGHSSLLPTKYWYTAEKDQKKK